jgi:hypothetical protein
VRILVVEDNRRMAASIKKALVEEAYAVDLAYDGEEGQVSHNGSLGHLKGQQGPTGWLGLSFDAGIAIAGKRAGISRVCRLSRFSFRAFWRRRSICLRSLS